MENLQKALNLTLQAIRTTQFSHTPEIFERHFRNLEVAELDDGLLVIIAPDDQVKTLNTRFRGMILSWLQNMESMQGTPMTDILFVTAAEYASAVEERSASAATPDILTPVVEEGSSVTVVSPEPQEEPAGGDENLELEMIWSGNYDQVVQPEKVITVPRYFLRHIPRMGAENAWLYIGFRQAAYQAGLHNGSKKVDIPSRQIARWAGIHQVTFWRRFAKTETWDALKGFVVKVKAGEWKQDNQDGRPHQAPNRYAVSMTIPLTPADVCSLRSYLINLAEDCGIEEAVKCALVVPPEELLIPVGDAAGNCDPMTVYQLVTSLGGSSKAASDLQAHIINYKDVVLLTQYFVETWLPRLKPGAAWMIAWMRDSSIPSGRVSATLSDIIRLTGVTQKTVREWLLDDVVKLFVFEDPARKTRGTDTQRTFLIRMDEPLENELGANATHRSNKQDDPLGAVVKSALGANATHRKTDEINRLGANATHRNDVESTRLGAIATHREEDSVPDWVQLQYGLGANATVKALINKESSIKLIKESTTTSLNLINSINNSDTKIFENESDSSPDGSPEGDTQLEAVDGIQKVFSPDLDQKPESEEFQEPGDTPADPDDRSDLEEQLEVVEEQEERIDPQALFHDILKRASVSLKIQRQFKDKPFYPFLAWLIYGASRDKIADPVAFAISRYETGLPGDKDAVELALDPDDLLADLEDYLDRWTMSRKLRHLFGEENGNRVELLANILGVERDDRYEILG